MKKKNLKIKDFENHKVKGSKNLKGGEDSDFIVVGDIDVG